MNRRKFVNTSLLSAATLATGSPVLSGNLKEEKKEIYELRKYSIRFGANQSVLHQYFEKALIPALNKYGCSNVGAFKELSKNEPQNVYLLIKYPGFDDFWPINAKIRADKDFIENSKNYNEIQPGNAVYTRISTSLMLAFDGLPKMKIPAKEPRIFELRTYEGFNEDALRRKVKMFNEGEFPIFYRAKLNPVFFGELFSGENLPCLTYMVHFKDMEERDANWKAFGADPEWKKLSGDPKYANSVSNIIRVFLEPLPYSQV